MGCILQFMFHPSLHSRSLFRLDVAGVVSLAQLGVGHCFHLGQVLVVLAGVDLGHALGQVLSLGRQVAAVQPPAQDGDVGLRLFRRAPGHAHAAHDAVEGQVGHAGDVAAHGSGHVVLDLQLLRAALGAGAAAQAFQHLGVEPDERGKGRRQLFQAVLRPLGGVEGDLGQVHPRLDERAAGQADVQLGIALLAVDGGAGAAEGGPAAHAPDQACSRRTPGRP